MNVHENYGHVNRPRIIVFLLALLMIIGHCSKAQTKTVIPSGHNPNQIVKFPALAMDSVLYLPKGCGAPPLAANYQIAYRGPMIYFDTCNTVLYVYNPHAGAWGAIANSADLNAYLKLVDTAAMLGPYARTIAVTAALALKLDITTAATTYYPIPTGTTSQYIQGNGSLATFPTGLPPTGAASGDLSGTYPAPNVSWPNGYTTYDAHYPTISASMGFASTITALENFGTSQTTVQVSDSLRGGIFNYVASGLTVDSGVVFNAAGKGSGFWKRQVTDNKYNAAWYNISTNQTSTNNRKRLNRMLGIIPKGAIVYFRSQDKFLIDSTITSTQKNVVYHDLNYAYDSTKSYFSNWMITGDSTGFINTRAYGASFNNLTAQRRSGFIFQTVNGCYMRDVTLSHFRKNGVEALNSTNFTITRPNGDSIYRDLVSFSPCQNCIIENPHNINSELGGVFEFSDSSNHCAAYNVYAENCSYAFDIDFHILGQINSDLQVIGLHAKNCATAYTHGITVANSGFINHDWTFKDWVIEGGTGNQNNNGDIDISCNATNVIFDNIAFRNMQYAGVIFKVQKVNTLTLANIHFPVNTANNMININGGVLTNTTGYGLILENITADSMSSTNSAHYGIQINNFSVVTITNCRLKGLTTFAGVMLNIIDVSNGNANNNTFDTSAANDAIYINPTTAQTNWKVYANSSSGTSKLLHVNGSFLSNLQAYGNTGSSGINSGSSTYAAFNIGSNFTWLEDTKRLGLGTTSPQWNLEIISPDATNIGVGQSTTKQWTLGVDVSGNVTESNTAGGTTHTITAGGGIILGGPLSLNGTFTNSNFTVPSATGLGASTISTAAFKPGISSQVVQPRAYMRGSANGQLVVNASYPGFEIATQNVITAASGVHDFAGSFTVLPPSITAGTALITNAYTAGFFGAPTGGVNNYSTFTTGIERHDGLFNSNGTTLTARQIWVANDAGTAMTGATVEQLSVPKVVASGLLTAQTATTNIVTYTTGAADSTFDISGRLTVTAFTAGTVQLTVNYTDETSTSRTGTFFPMGLTTAALSAAGASNFPVMGSIRVKASTTITVIATVTGTLTFTGAAKIIKLP